jgi:hypothetical protein
VLSVLGEDTMLWSFGFFLMILRMGILFLNVDTVLDSLMRKCSQQTSQPQHDVI